jgi:HK97 family phage prohead protease
MAVQLIKRAELEVVDPASVKLRGYAAVFGNVFSQGFWIKHRYKVMPGAFTGVLERLDEPLPVFWSHQQERLQIGETTELKQDSKGLYFEANPFNTEDSLDVLAVMNSKESQRVQASFAFDFGEVIEDDEGIEEIHSFSRLYELGPTTWGANPLAFAELVPRDAEALAIDDETEKPAEPAAIEPADEEQAALAADWWQAVAMLRSNP